MLVFELQYYGSSDILNNVIIVQVMTFYGSFVELSVCLAWFNYCIYRIIKVILKVKVDKQILLP